MEYNCIKKKKVKSNTTTESDLDRVGDFIIELTVFGNSWIEIDKCAQWVLRDVLDLTSSYAGDNNDRVRIVEVTENGKETIL